MTKFYIKKALLHKDKDLRIGFVTGLFTRKAGNPRASDCLWSYELKADRGFYKLISQCSGLS